MRTEFVVKLVSGHNSRTAHFVLEELIVMPSGTHISISSSVERRFIVDYTVFDPTTKKALIVLSPCNFPHIEEFTHIIKELELAGWKC
jgi:hypothetical protein